MADPAERPPMPPRTGIRPLWRLREVIDTPELAQPATQTREA